MCAGGLYYSTSSTQSYAACYLAGSPCPPDKPLVYCFADPCEVTTCPAFPNAKCVSDFCGGCNARFFEGGKEVTENCLQGGQWYMSFLYAYKI